MSSFPTVASSSFDNLNGIQLFRKLRLHHNSYHASLHHCGLSCNSLSHLVHDFWRQGLEDKIYLAFPELLVFIPVGGK